MEFGLIVAAIVLAELAIARWAYDSRDGFRVDRADLQTFADRLPHSPAVRHTTGVRRAIADAPCTLAFHVDPTVRPQAPLNVARPR